MSTFQYIDKGGQMKTVDAADSNAALSSASNIDIKSGVRLIDTPLPPIPPVATAPGATEAPKTAPIATPTSTTPEGQGMDPGSFHALLGRVGDTFKLNNEFASQRQLLIKHLYDSPLTPDELSKLPKDIQDVVNGGNKDNLELQIRVLNDQLQGRAGSLSSTIKALSDGYDSNQTAVKNAVGQFLAYSEATGQPIDKVVKALAPLYGVNVTDAVMKNLEELGIAVKPAAGVQVNGSGGVLSDLANSLAAQESGGKYDAVGIATSTGEKALGKYQIMPSAWFSSIGLDPKSETDKQKFLATPDLQDKLFQHVLDSLSTKYKGDSAKIAAAYYGGDAAARIVGTPAGDKPQAGGMPSVNQYVNSVIGRISVNAAAPSSLNANVPDTLTGLTPNLIYHDAQDYLFTGGSIQQYVGGLSSGVKQSAAKNAIANKAAAIADSLGLTFPQAQALYKANASAIKQNTERVARVDSIANSVVNQMPRLASLADNLSKKGIAMTETDLQSGQAKILAKFGDTEAAQYAELLQTIRADYSASNAALAGSRGGEFFAKSAVDAIPAGYTGDQYNALKDTIVQSSKNIKDGVQQTIQGLISGIGGSNSGGDTKFDSTSARSKYNY